MKNLKFIYLLPVLFVFTFSGCTKKYEDLLTLTNYANFEMTGDEVIFNTFGTNFTDPGVKATEAGTEIPVTTVVSGDFFGASSFDPTAADRYLYTYYATNSDGYEASTSRLVYNVKTGDLVNSIEGLYTSTIVRNGSTGAQYTNMKYVLIAKSGDKYKISDAIGGYYDIGRGYGAGYRASGMTITANNIASNDFSFGAPVGAGAFGGAVNIDAMTVDAASKTIKITAIWDAGYTFVITLKQVQL